MTTVKQIIESKESEFFKFKPTRDFYKMVGIGQKRWGKIIRDEVPLTIPEMLALSKYFGVKPEIFL